MIKLSREPRLVGVIASPSALAKAERLKRPPDLFELRLDALHGSLATIDQTLPRLRAPIILTARHPREGGIGNLGSKMRRSLLESFLSHGALLDLELRSVRQMRSVMEEARAQRIGLIISVHDLKKTPPPKELDRLTESVAAFRPAIFKIATRTDTREQFERLIAFFRGWHSTKFRLAAMGIGRLGLESRLQLDRLGSALTYVSLGETLINCQPSLSQLRRARRAYIR
jgi:3-dehydroquinate dehydratase-1